MALGRSLSQVLIAFTIEFDNEFEARMFKTWARPFLTSMVMWSNVMRYVTPNGITVGELTASSGLSSGSVGSLVGGLERWSYLTVDHDPATGVATRRPGFGTARGVKPDTVLRPSMSGEVAIRAWQGLEDDVTARWRDRLGHERIDALRTTLAAVRRRIDTAMPSYLPVVASHGLFVRPAVTLPPNDGHADAGLASLLSAVLLQLALDYEAESDVSIAIAGNVLRAAAEPRRVRDLPLAAGISKEAASMSLTWLDKQGYVTVEGDAKQGKVVSLTDKGRDACDAHSRRIVDVEEEWQARFGATSLATLRSTLASILDEPGGPDGPLSAGLVPPATGWRAKGRYKPLTDAFVQRPADALAHHPMVLHRGGWPDGS